jgi:Ca-activated chloride channel family protein
MITFANVTYSIYIALIVFIVLVFYTVYIVWKRRVLYRLFAREQMRIILRGIASAGIFREILICISIVLAGFILLRPQWGERIREVKKEGVDMLVAMDVSMSMFAQDVSPNRFSRARDAVKLIAESLRGDRIGLILFAGDSFLQCPLTDDIGAFMMFLDSVGNESIRLQGTDIGGAIDEAQRVFSRKRNTSRILVIITDGEDHEGRVMDAVERFRELEVRIYAVGVGKGRGDLIPLKVNGSSDDMYLKGLDGKLVRSRKHSELLKRISRETGGDYIDITDSISGIYQILDAISALARNEYGSRVIKERKEQYQIFTMILILLLSIEIMIPERRRRKK